MAELKKKASVNAKTETTKFVSVSAPAVDVYSKEIVTELNRHVKVIRSEMNKVESSFTKIAFNLYWIYNSGSFKALGADNIYSFAKNEFGISRGTTSNFINVVERFGKKIDGHILPEISDEYRGYKSSQLIVMLGMKDDELKNVNKDMSVREIKKISKKSASDTVREGRYNSSGKSDEKESVIDVESSESNRTVMFKVKDLDDYLKHIDTIDMQIRRALAAKNGKYTVEISYTWN